MTSKLRILISAINYAPDLIGVSKYNTELCEWLAARGHHVHIVTAPPYYPEWKIPAGHRKYWYSSETRNHVSVKRVPIYVPKKPTGPKRLIHHASFAISGAIPLLARARTDRPDLLVSVAPSLMSSAFAAFVARRIGIPSWLHLQDFEVDAAFDLGLLRGSHLASVMFKAERRILGAFDRVSTIAPQLIRRLERKDVHPDKIREIRNWVDVNAIVPRDRKTMFWTQLGFADTDVIALYSGTMSTKQGLELMLEAARAVRASHPHVKFILSGEGPQKAKLQAIATDLDNVHFLGLQSNEHFAQLINTADFHVIPQRAEAADLVLPSKLGGIFASGKPVIAMAASNTGLAQEVLGAGLVVPPGEVGSLAGAIRKMSDDGELRRSLGVASRQRALEKWNKEQILQFLEHEFEALRSHASRNVVTHDG